MTNENVYTDSSTYLMRRLSVLVGTQPWILRLVLASADQGQIPMGGQEPVQGWDASKAGEARSSSSLTHEGNSVCLRQSI